VVNVSWNDAVAFLRMAQRKEGRLIGCQRSGVGICLPCGDNDSILVRRRPGGVGAGGQRGGRHGEGEVPQ